MPIFSKRFIYFSSNFIGSLLPFFAITVISFPVQQLLIFFPLYDRECIVLSTFSFCFSKLLNPYSINSRDSVKRSSIDFVLIITEIRRTSPRLAVMVNPYPAVSELPVLNHQYLHKRKQLR